MSYRPSGSTSSPHNEPRPAKRRRSDVSEEYATSIPRPPPTSYPTQGPSILQHPYQSRSSSPSSDEDQLDNGGEARPGTAVDAESSGNWRYSLQIIQQPQRARACGFGDKDRRPLSPPPIIRLWIHDAKGELVDSRHVSIHFLVLIVDLWSSDGSQQRSVVAHANAQSARPSIPEFIDHSASESTRSDIGASRPNTGYPAFTSGWRFTSVTTSEAVSPTSPLSSVHDTTISSASPAPEWPTRSGPPRTQSLSIDPHTSIPTLRPMTAPSSQVASAGYSETLTLSPLSAITSRPDLNRPFAPTLPALRDTRFSGSSTSSQNRVSWSTSSSQPSTELSMTFRREKSSSVSEMTRTANSSFSRPSTSGGLFPPDYPYPSSESSFGLPQTPEAQRHSLPLIEANHSRVLVGSLTSTCQRLEDEHGRQGLFFFAHDLGIRTEGVFSLKFTLTNLASLMTGGITPGASSKTLAEVFSDPFTVFSAKRFPGVIPTTDLTRLFASQNVRLPTRQRRPKDSQDGSGEDE